MTSPRPDSGSFRDRGSRVVHHRGGIYRALGARAAADWRAVAGSPFLARGSAAGRLVATSEVDLEDPAGREVAAALPGTAAVLRHEAIPFVSYPFEWPFGMLRAAALLQLDLLAEALAEGVAVKDASPYNVQWRGAAPVFIDWGSFAPWAPGDPWVGYRQFCRLFLYPLLLTAYRDVPFQPWLKGALEGIAPEEADRLLGRWRDRLRPGVFAHVFLQARLATGAVGRDRALRSELRAAGFDRGMILANVGRLRRVVDGLAWRRTSSTWSDYAGDNSYAAADRAAKERFVARATASRSWRLAWDLGANTGAFSRLVAPHAATVVAFDADHLAVERHYRGLVEAGPGNVLPLVVDLADPSPARGWRLRERLPLLERGRPDLVLALALIHHLSLSAHVPLPEVVEGLAELGGSLVVEWVDRADPKVRRLLADRDDAYDDYRREVFEETLARHFEVAAREDLPGGTRALYFAMPLGG